MGTRAPLTARAAALAYAGIGVYGARVAVADKEPARFAGLSYPGSPASQFLWAGTALSAPVYVLGAYLHAGFRGDRRRLTLLAAATIAGQLGEPIAWRAAGRQRVIVAANLVLPAIMLVSLRRRPRVESRP